ncbi:MAG TPA: DUF1573 domain-containing protein [Ignavibacteriaceae bacterium]|nr:DUF1573 domain-containing protein [Ignavibacteriaceae bacterium]
MLNKIFAVLFLLTSVSFAQMIGPKAVVQQKVHDFGDVNQGEIVKASFLISNSGGDLLEIMDVRASCGCTAAKPEKSQLKPGESTKVDVNFNTKGRRGIQQQRVTVTTNDPANQQLVLTIKANVVIPEKTKAEAPKIQFNNSQYNFGKVKEGQVYQHTFTFSNTGSRSLNIKDVKSSCGCAVASISQKELMPGESATLKVELDTAKRKGRMSRTLTVISNDPENPNTILTLYAEVEG